MTDQVTGGISSHGIPRKSRAGVTVLSLAYVTFTITVSLRESIVSITSEISELKMNVDLLTNCTPIKELIKRKPARFKEVI